MKAFRIKGRITDKKSGRGIPDLFVKAIDKDLLFDDLLSEVITDEKGYFQIVYDKRDYRELFFKKRPALYLRITTFSREEVVIRNNRVRYLREDTKDFKISISAVDYFPFTPTFEINVIRPQDFLSIRFKFFNLKVTGENLKHHNLKRPAYIVAEFPPQNIAEEAFFEVAEKEEYEFDADRDQVDSATTGEEFPYFPCQSRLANPSRLVFKVSKGDTIPYTTDGLLNACSQYDLSVAPTAFPPLLFLHPKIKPSQLLKRVELLENIKIYLAKNIKADALSSGIHSEDESGFRMDTGSAAGNWIARSSLKKYLPQVYDNSVRKEIAELFVQARFIIKPKLRPPSETETSIEAPYRLLISPNKYAAWAHAKDPVVSPATKRTELWHTRYALRISGNVVEEDNRLKTIRAIWTRDPFFSWMVESTLTDESHHYNPGSPNLVLNPFRMSLDAFDRENIVHLTANQHISNYFPTPVDVKNLMLTSFGAWMNTRGAWEPPSGSKLSVEEWRHRGTMGRDHYVRVVYKGYLFPFGHRASLIKVTERKFHPQVLFILDYAGMLFTTKVSAFAKTFDTSSRSAATSFIQDVTESYTRNVSNLVHSISEKSRSQVDDLIKHSEKTFKKEAENLVSASGEKTRSQLSSLAENAEKAFKTNITNIVEAIKDIKVVNVPGNIAYLRQRMYIVVREPERLYIDSGVEKYNNQLPFARVEITTLVTPDLNEPSLTEVVPGKGQTFFWPKVGSNLFQFHVIAEDFAGNEIDFTAPLIFTESTLLGYKDANGANIPGKFGNINDVLEEGQKQYQEDVQPDFAGQSLMFADSSSDPGKTTFETKNINFSVELLKDEIAHDQLKASLSDDDFPQFYPKVVQAEVLIPSIKHLAGNGQSTKIKYGNTYLEHGFDVTNNKGQIFANLIEGLDLDFNSQGDRSGGLAKPNMAISGLSRLMGPVAGDNLSPLEQGTFDPKEFFGGLDAKIFGVINLWDIIEMLLPNNFLDDDCEKIPKLLPVVTKEKIEVGFEYKPPLKDWNNLFIASNNGKKAEFELSAKLTAYTAGGADINIYCGLENFSIDLIGCLESFIVVHFNHIAFKTSGGKKAEVDVDLGEIEFVGILSFVETLKEYIPLDGFSDPPSLDVTEKGITAGFSLTLPTIAVGVFSLQNLSLGAAFVLPFLVDPLSVRFNFCERQSPFLLTVSMFGGGGFFAITVDPAGVQQLEASFEFGASVSVSFGVASGGVYVMAGIYFMMEANPEKAELTGYFRMGGEVDVLGIISVSIELYLSLKYEFSSGKCVGKATLTIEIEVLFFSASVEISCERKFAGSNGDPTFKELMEPYVDPVSTEEIKPWEIYCQAYA